MRERRRGCIILFILAAAALRAARRAAKTPSNPRAATRTAATASSGHAAALACAGLHAAVKARRKQRLHLDLLSESAGKLAQRGLKDSVRLKAGLVGLGSE